VPKTAIHKDRNLRGPKNKIRPPRHRRVPPPTAHASFAKQTHQHEFSRFIPASSHRPHNIGAFGFAECVGHTRNMNEAKTFRSQFMSVVEELRDA
jgi:hypothetical protein